MKKLFIKNWLLAFALLTSLIVLFLCPKVRINALTFTAKNILSFLCILIPIFICIGFVDVWIERDTMIKTMGKKSGVKGAIISLMLGMITAVSIYDLLPVTAVVVYLKRKGSHPVS